MIEGVKIKFTQFPDGVSLSLSIYNSIDISEENPLHAIARRKSCFQAFFASPVILFILSSFDIECANRITCKF